MRPSHLQGGPAVRRKGLVDIVHPPLSIWQCMSASRLQIRRRCDLVKKQLQCYPVQKGNVRVRPRRRPGSLLASFLFVQPFQECGTFNNSAPEQLLFDSCRVLDNVSLSNDTVSSVSLEVSSSHCCQDLCTAVANLSGS